MDLRWFLVLLVVITSSLSAQAQDAKKTAETFKTINGVRYSIPGDWCIVEADGTLTLLGRGRSGVHSLMNYSA